MHEDLVVQLLIVVFAAVVGAALFERMRLPAIAGLLLVGALVGPGGFGLLQETERVRELAEFGVVLLLFEIGLEIPLGVLRRVWRQAVLSGALQVGLTLAGVTAAAMWLGVPTEAAIVVGMLASMSSTALVMRLLADKGEVDAPHGRLVVGILLFQDLCLAPFLLSVPILAGMVPREPGPLALAIGWELVAVVGLFVVARFALPWVLARIARLRSRDLFSLVAFLLAVGSAVVAEELGLTLAVGAFIAGLVLNASPYAHQLFAEVVPLRGILLGIFFTAVGMLLDPAAALAQWQGILAFVAGVVVFKAAVIAGVVLFVLRQGMRLAVLSSLALAQSGEFSFVLAEATAAAGVLDPTLQQIFVAGSVLTLIATPFLMQGAARLARSLAEGADRLQRRAGEPLAEPVRDHVVIVGFGLAGRTLARVLAASRIPYRAVDQNPRVAEDAHERGDHVVFGDATRGLILEHLGIRRARLLCIAINDPEATRRCLSMARSLAPELRIVVRTRYVSQLDELLALGANEVVAEEFEAAIDLFRKVLGAFEVPPQAVEQFAEAMRMEGYEFLRETDLLALDPWLAEILEEVSTEWVEVPPGPADGKTLVDLQVRAKTGASVLAVRRGDRTTPNPPPHFGISAGDALLVLTPPDGLRKLRALLAGEGPPRPAAE